MLTDKDPDQDRRRSPRAELVEPLRIDTSTRKNRIAVTKNVSGSGVLFRSPSRFSLGERLHVTLHDDDDARRRTVTGTVVWRAETDPHRASPFSALTAVEFDEPVDGGR